MRKRTTMLWALATLVLLGGLVLAGLAYRRTKSGAPEPSSVGAPAVVTSEGSSEGGAPAVAPISYSPKVIETGDQAIPAILAGDKVSLLKEYLSAKWKLSREEQEQLVKYLKEKIPDIEERMKAMGVDIKEYIKK